MGLLGFRQETYKVPIGVVVILRVDLRRGREACRGDQTWFCRVRATRTRLAYAVDVACRLVDFCTAVVFEQGMCLGFPLIPTIPMMIMRMMTIDHDYDKQGIACAFMRP